MSPQVKRVEDEREVGWYIAPHFHRPVFVLDRLSEAFVQRIAETFPDDILTFVDEEDQ